MTRGSGCRSNLSIVGASLAAVLIATPIPVAGRGSSTITVTPVGGQQALEAALAVARTAKGAVEIVLAPGMYRLTSPIQLRSGGTQDAPLRIAGAPGGPVILTGSALATPVALPVALTRLLPAASREAVRAYRLTPAIVSAFAREAPRSAVSAPSVSPVVVTQGEQLLHLARWPNEGFAHAQASAQPGPHVVPEFAAPPGKAGAWAREPMLRAGGYWSVDWDYEAARVASVDPSRGLVRMPPLVGKYRERNILRYRVLNAFSELDAPGEYAVDPATSTLVVWPLSAAPVEIAKLKTIVDVDRAHNVAIDGIALQGAQGDALVIQHASGVSFTNGFLGLVGGNGATISDSQAVTVSRTVVSDTGETGVSVAGGDKAALTSAGNVVSDSLLRRFGLLTRTYRPGVKVDGVGQRVIGNFIGDAPHSAIIFLGNNHRIAGNEITRVLNETGDSGAIYTFQDLSARGTVIEGNYIHGIRRPSDLAEAGWSVDDRAIYLDGWASGVTVRSNLIAATPWPVFINSGSDNVIADNAFVGATPYAIVVLNLASIFREPRFERVRRTADRISPAMRQAYHIRPNDPSIADGYPRRNRFVSNLVIGGKAIGFFDKAKAPYLSPRIASDQQIKRQTLVWPPAGPGAAPASILKFAHEKGYVTRMSVDTFERTKALAGLRYRMLQGP